MPDIASNGITLHYADTGGDGRPVVLVHGWPLSGDSWSHQVPALVADGYRVITYDRRGFGASDKPDGGYDYDTLAADLAGLLDGLDLTDAVLVGFSMGGGEVVRYLASYGDARVGAAVLAAAVPPYLLRTEGNRDGGLDEDAVEEMKDGVRKDRESFLEGFTRDFFSADGALAVTEEQRREALALASPASDEAVVACIDAFARTDFRDDLDRVAVRTLVIHGDADAIVPLEVSGRRAAEQIRDARFVVVPNGPHGFNVSHADEFNGQVLAFLRR